MKQQKVLFATIIILILGVIGLQLFLNKKISFKKTEETPALKDKEIINKEIINEEIEE